MRVAITGKNMDLTPALREYAEKKVSKLERFLDRTKGEVVAQILMRVERDAHVVEVTLQTGGVLLRGETRTADMYASIDGVLEKIEGQIRKHKTRLERVIKHDTARAQSNELLQGAEEDFPEGESAAIVRTKRFAIKPMSPEEAVMQMDLLGHDFFVFANANTNEVNVVYRRKGGNYGLIEPELG